jgi:predicted esterase
MKSPRALLFALATPLVFGALGAAGTLSTACSSSSSSSSGDAGGPAQALFVVPATLDELADVHYLDHPWPSDLRKDADGSVHFAGLYNPHQTILLSDYLDAAKGLVSGFSTVGAAYLRFTADLDATSLPATPQDTLDAKASVQLIDVSSSDRGKRHLVQTLFRKDEGVYWLPDTLAVLPALGVPLRPGTQYALVATRALRSASGQAVTPSADLEEVLGTRPATPRTDAARAAFGAALGEIEKAGVARADIAHLTVFTTTDPTAELFAVNDDVHATVPAPTVRDGTWAQKEQTADYDVYEGTYGPSPNYQAGKLPFAQKGDGGGFVFDAQKKPTLQGTFDLRFALVVPNAQKCAPPAAGYPVVLYAHGTGGDYRSMIDDKTSQALAQQCLASMGIDQIFHGTRPGAPPASDPNREGNIELLFFNLNNIVAARTNGRQAAIDVTQQARLFGETHAQVPAATSRTGQAIAIDPAKILFFGHSQGSLNGPLYLAADPSARGGVLSGAGSMIAIALLEKTKPQPSVAQAVKTLLQLISPDEQAELSIFHPVMSFAQALVDAVDPVNYDGYVVQHPRAGLGPKSIYETEGINPDGTGDSYAPPHGIEIGAVALGLPRQAPGVRAVVEMAFAGLGDVTVPATGLAGNLAGGKASGVLAQWQPPATSDGHFVVFDVPQARAQAAGFCKNLADDPIGKVPAP